MTNIKLNKLNWANIAAPTNWNVLQENPFVFNGGAIPNGTVIIDDLVHEPTFKKIKEHHLNQNPIPKVKVLGDMYVYKRLNSYVGLPGNIPLRAPSTNVGVEIELEGVEVKNSVGTWKITDDGSLKVNGAEFISIPIQFKYLEVELTRLFGSVNNSFASSRCSVHVHINVRDFTLQELRNFILLYMVFEKSLFRVSGNRWNSNFCVPLFSYPDCVRTVINRINTENRLYEKWYKYFALNISPIFGGESTKLGTVEFRHMEGCTDVPRIINWINLIVSLKVAAKELNYEDFIKDLSSMNSTSSYVMLAKTVFKWLYVDIVGQRTFKEDIESCITKTKYVLSKPSNTKICNTEIAINFKDM